MPDETLYELKIVLGQKKIEPIEFRMTEERGKFFIETDFVRLGPVDSEHEAVRLLAMARSSTRPKS